MSPMKAMDAGNRCRIGTNVFISLICLLMIDKLLLQLDTCPGSDFFKTEDFNAAENLIMVDYGIIHSKKEFTPPVYLKDPRALLFIFHKWVCVN